MFLGICFLAYVFWHMFGIFMISDLYDRFQNVHFLYSFSKIFQNALLLLADQSNSPILGAIFETILRATISIETFLVLLIFPLLFHVNLNRYFDRFIIAGVFTGFLLFITGV